MTTDNFHRQTFFIFLLVSRLSSSCDPESPCGCSTQPAILSKIVGGEPVRTPSWPWIVSISLAEKFFCGGTILSESWIITAAHCVQRVRVPRITVYAGSIMRWAGSQQRQVRRKIVHPGNDPKRYTNDIALLELTEPLDLMEPDIKPICLGPPRLDTPEEREWPPINVSVVAAGWGRLSEDGPKSAILQQVTLKTIDHRESHCQSIIADWKVQFCADDRHANKDTCQGDSGGPLMMFDADRRWILVGITSYGYGCARMEYSGVYTRVAAYADWIEQHTSVSYVFWAPLSMRSQATIVCSIRSVLSLFVIFSFFSRAL